MNLSQDEINAMMGLTSEKPDAGLDTADAATDLDAATPVAATPEDAEAAAIFDSIAAAIEPPAVASAESSAAPSTEAVASPPVEATEGSAGASGLRAMPTSEFDGIRDSDMILDESFDRSKYTLTNVEIDLLGEVGNMCMGRVATTMYQMLDRPVTITTPHVSVHTMREVLSAYRIPFVVAEVEYTMGIEGKNVLLLKENDAAMITDLLMGGDGKIEEPIVLGELHMSAISEVMNQIIAQSATTMSEILQIPIDISPPISQQVAANDDISDKLGQPEVVIKISFDMEIEGLLQSQLLQLMPYQLGRDLTKSVAEAMGLNSDGTAPPLPASPPTQVQQQQQSYLQHPQQQQPYPQQQQPYPQQQQPYPQQPYQQQPYSQPAINVTPMQYTNFDPAIIGADVPQTFGLVHDIPLQVSVVLGKTSKSIEDILDFTTGTVVILDKVVGDAVEVIANGKLIARGEVVAIEENYGVRITDIFSN